MKRSSAKTLSVGRLLLLATCAPCGCSQMGPSASQSSNSTFVVAFTAQRSATEPLAGVNLIDSNKKVIGTTDPSGKATLRLTGVEGDTAEITVQCPDGFASPDKPISVGLRHLAAGSPQPTFAAECQALVHTVVVGIRAENGPNLPIVRLDQVVGQTDPSGAAHILVEAAPGEQITLALKTPDSFRPQNPTLAFVASDRGELVLLSQKFAVLKPKVRVKSPPPKPMRL